MASVNPTITRRQLLRSAGVGAAGLALTGTLGEIFGGALSSSASRAAGTPRAAAAPRWHSRPDLQIPALSVSHSEQGVSTDLIFIAPYNAPNAQAGAVIVDNSGEAIWENPRAGKVTTNFQVQRYRGSPVLTWWEGSIELGHGVGEYVIADASYRTVRRVQAAGGLHGDLHEFVITPRDTALLTSYVVRDHDLSAVGGSRSGTIQDAIFQEIDLASGDLLLEWHSLDHIPLSESYAGVTADWDFFHINSVGLDGDGNLLVSGRSTHTVYKLQRSGKILWRLGGKRGDFDMGAGSSFAWQHDARRQPDGTLDSLRQRRHAGRQEALARADPRRRRAGDDSDAAQPVHPPGDPRGQPGQHAAAGKRQRVRRLGRSAARVRVQPRGPDRVRRDARREVRVLQGLSPALDRYPGRCSGDCAGGRGARADRLCELERRDRGAQLAAAGGRLRAAR